MKSYTFCSHMCKNNFICNAQFYHLFINCVYFLKEKRKCIAAFTLLRITFGDFSNFLQHQMDIDDLYPWYFPMPSNLCSIVPGSNHDFMNSTYRVVLSSPVV